MKKGKEPTFPELKLIRLFYQQLTQPIVNVMDKGWEKKRIDQIPGEAKVIFEIRQPLRHAPIGFFLKPKDFENRQFGVKSPHLVTLMFKAKFFHSRIFPTFLWRAQRCRKKVRPRTCKLWDRQHAHKSFLFCALSYIQILKYWHHFTKHPVYLYPCTPRAMPLDDFANTIFTPGTVSAVVISISL